jgi:hypothetical protein
MDEGNAMSECEKEMKLSLLREESPYEEVSRSKPSHFSLICASQSNIYPPTYTGGLQKFGKRS